MPMRDDPPPVEATQVEPDSLPAGDGPEAPLELWLLGTGTPRVLPDRFGPSTLLRAADQLMLVDCGNGSAYRLVQLGMRLEELTHIFITHHHVDHNVDLGFLLLSPWISLPRSDEFHTPFIIGPPGTTDYVNEVLAAHRRDIRARLPHGYDPSRLAASVVEVSHGTEVSGHCWRATAIEVDHYPVEHAFGYRFDGMNASVVVSGDTRPNDNLIEAAQGADVLVHEVIYPGYGFPEYHTLSTDVGKVAAAAEVKHLVLTHLLPGHIEEEAWLDHARRDFDGPVTVGRDLLKIL